MSNLLFRLQDHIGTFQETSPLYSIFSTANIYICFCIAIIKPNKVWVVFKSFLIKNKMFEDDFFFTDFKINCEYVEILMKFLAFCSLIN